MTIEEVRVKAVGEVTCAISFQGRKRCIESIVWEESDFNSASDGKGIAVIQRGIDDSAILVVEVGSRVESKLVGDPGAYAGALPQSRRLDTAAGSTRGALGTRLLEHTTS